MSDEKNDTGSKSVISSTDLAFERTILAHERTLMAWVRTATSMISFGFTLYKFFEEVSNKRTGPKGLFTPRIVGIMMILFGFLGLLLALIQHVSEMKKIKQSFRMYLTPSHPYLLF